MGKVPCVVIKVVTTILSYSKLALKKAFWGTFRALGQADFYHF